MGCGQHLHVMPGGMLRCLAIKCPDPGAAHKILADPETGHVIDVTDDGWTLKHPLRERTGDGLFACKAGEVVSRAGEEGALLPGRWRLLPGENGATAAFQFLPGEEQPRKS